MGFSATCTLLLCILLSLSYITQSFAFQTSSFTYSATTLSITYPDVSISGTNRYQTTTATTSLTIKTRITGLPFTSLPIFQLINCGVLMTPLLDNSTSTPVEYFTCETPQFNSMTNIVSVEVKPKNTQFVEGTFVVSLGLSFGKVLSQIEIDVLDADGMDAVLVSGRSSSMLALNLSMPSFSVINPMLPTPSIDSQTGQMFLPMKKSFFLNAKLTTKLKNTDANIQYIWDVVKISDTTMELKSSLSKRGVVKNSLGNYDIVTNYVQDREQTNRLGLSILSFTEDADFEFDSVYRISCVAKYSGSVFIGRSNDIYLRTPKRVFPLVAQVGSVFSISPLVSPMTTEFTFNVTAPFVYDDGSNTPADSNLMFAFGYVNARLANHITGGTDTVIKSGMSDIPTSEISQYLVQVTPYSSSRIHKTYLPPGFSLRAAETFNNTMILDHAPLDYRQNPVLFVHDKYYGLTRVFIMSGGMCVCPVPLETVYPLIEELKNRVMQGSLSSLQINSLMGMVQKAYDGGEPKYINLIQRSAFSIFVNLVNLVEKPINNPSNKTAYADAVSNIMSAAKILQMWSFNATQYLSVMASEKEDEIVNGIERFVKIIRADARSNYFSGDSSKNQPLGRIDSSLISSVCSSLSNIIQINTSIRSRLINSIKLMTSSILDSISPSEGKTVTTDKLTFIVKKDYGSTFNSSDLVMGGSNAITVPKGAIVQKQTVSNSDLLGTEYVLYSDNPNSDTNQANTSQIVSNVLSLRCINNGGEYYPLNDLSDPISLSFSVEASRLDSVLKNNNVSIENITCRYWNETLSDWKTNGCYVSNYTKTSVNGVYYYSINMKASHTTQFAVFVELSQELSNIQNYTTEQKIAYHTLWGFQIAIGAIICVVSLVMLVMLFIFRNRQPIKAKYVAPFIGMVCIFLDALLGSVTKSAVMLGYSVSGSEYSPIALNSLTYISATILGVALSISVLAFMIQTIRYHLLRNMYSLLLKSETKALKLLSIVTSRGIYIVSVIVLFVIIFLYMGGMTAARISQEVIDNSSGLTSRIYTIATSSFIGAILVLSLVVLSIIFISDVILSYSKNLKIQNSNKGTYAGLENSTVELKDVSTSQIKKDPISADEAIKLVKEYSSNGYRFFIMDDPLLFRAETLLFITCLLILVISYVFGIVNLGLFTSNYSTKLSTTVSSFEISLVMEIVRLILTVVYFVLYMFVFGGLSLLFYFKKYRNNSTKKENEDSQELFDMLDDELGSKLFEIFCAKEFSLENLKCYREILQIKQSPNMVKDCATFRDRFLSPSSPLEVNISNHTRKLFTSMFEKSSERSEYEQALETMTTDIVLNLSDTFSRFGVSNDYATWQKLRTQRAQFTSKTGMSI